jgi:hypothetical protein
VLKTPQLSVANFFSSSVSALRFPGITLSIEYGAAAFFG